MLFIAHPGSDDAGWPGGRPGGRVLPPGSGAPLCHHPRPAPASVEGAEDVAVPRFVGLHKAGSKKQEGENSYKFNMYYPSYKRT